MGTNYGTMPFYGVSMFVQGILKENDDIIWRFMASKHATPWYEELHGNRSHTHIV